MSKGKIDRKTYGVLIDYIKIISDLVPSNTYNNINTSSTLNAIKVEVETTCFNRCLKLKDLPRELNKIGHRLANLEEFLAFGAQHPKVQRMFPVVTYINNLLFTLSFCGVPDSWSSYGWRELTVDKLKDNSHSFHDGVRFLTVKK